MVAIENVTGSSFSDTLTASNLANLITGGPGEDTVSYLPAPNGISLSLLSGTTTGWGPIDTLVGIEDATGSAFADSLIGNSLTNRIIGGAGVDTTSYEGSPNGVVVDLSTGSVSGWGADILSGIENVTGSAFADNITGSASANTLRGLGGIDVLHGLGGADLLFGGIGNDSLFGENGNDQLNGEAGNDTLNGGAGVDSCAQGTGTGARTGCES